MITKIEYDKQDLAMFKKKVVAKHESQRLAFAAEYSACSDIRIVILYKCLNDLFPSEFLQQRIEEICREDFIEFI